MIESEAVEHGCAALERLRGCWVLRHSLHQRAWSFARLLNFKPETLNL
jgi:hypothetical protein